MTFEEYQAKAQTTAIYPRPDSTLGKCYCALKLNGEAGEVAEKIGKVLRDQNGVFDDQKRYDIALELGDVLWYLAMLAREFGYTLDQVANLNINKLTSRHRRGKVGGSGDNR